MKVSRDENGSKREKMHAVVRCNLPSNARGRVDAGVRTPLKNSARLLPQGLIVTLTVKT